MAWLFIGEPITLNMQVGIGLILLGSCFSLASKRKQSLAAKKAAMNTENEV